MSITIRSVLATKLFRDISVLVSLLRSSPTWSRIAGGLKSSRRPRWKSIGSFFPHFWPSIFGLTWLFPQR